ncbi:DnaB-like helicase C-terminal domain-containing protein [Amycolatopsis sp. cmx-11-32]|uniref:DnaB-like helicase C-terminal domain-containing protein n=1 Tax=Amycolatopsis sp. cmx-11-32 TaxID=2785796 RepID=UPI0039E64192
MPVVKRLALDTERSSSPHSCLPTRAPANPARPSLADLRDSGTIAHVADYVVLLHRPDAWDRDDPRAGGVDLILAKHEHGPTATTTVAHQLRYGRLVVGSQI